jgi:acyl-CoA synthetase (NDP forming)
VYPVNPNAAVVQSVPAYDTVETIPGPVDLAVIAVPADGVIPVAEQCARKGVRSLLVVSAGFAEIGASGLARQQALRSVCRRAGMRLIGPNCLGVINTDPRSPLNAIFAPSTAIAGPVGFASQSGALGLAAISEATSRGLGISSFVSMGNKADISGNDLLNYWETDPRTQLILLYLESFGNPRNFSRIARRLSRVKPIVAVKSGRSTSGARAAASHTGALVSGSDAVVDALFRQTGVIRTDTLAQLFDVATLLAFQPVPRGRRVGIVTNVGGPAILCADACEAGGLELPPLSNETRERLRAILPPEASVANPVDMLAQATADQFRQTVEIVGRDPDVDSLIALFIEPLAIGGSQVASALLDADEALEHGKPIMAVLMGCPNAQDLLSRGERRIPAFDFPESAAQALAKAARFGEWRAAPPQPAAEPPDVRRDEAAAIVAEALARGAGWLEPDEVSALLACYGLGMPRQRIVTDPEAVLSAAACLHRPIALKAQVPGLVHKSDLGAVRLGLAGPKAALSAARRMSTRLAAAGHEPTGYLLQEMAPSGTEMLVGVVHDPLFGPVVACGAGGVMVEVLKDVSVRIAPLTHADATEMIESLRSFPLLTGFRGAPPRDVAALENIVLRIGALAEDLPEIAEMDCNPVIVHEHGAVIVDARVRVQTAGPRPPLGAR